MKRFVTASVFLSLVVCAYACSSSSDGGNKNNGTQPGGGGDGTGTPGGGDGTGGGGDGTGGTGGTGGGDLTKNPIEGIDAVKPVLETGAFTDGPVWHKGLKVLFFSTPLGEGGLYRMRPDGSAMKVMDGTRATGEIPIGNSIDPSGALVMVQAKRILRGTPGGDGGAPTVWASGYSGGTSGGGGGADGGAPPPSTGGQFDTLNDAVVGKDGTAYATDPGYFATPAANRIYRITKTGTVQVVEEFSDVPRPNGVALTPDGKALYVGFSEPIQGTMPFIRKYIVNADGTLGEHTKWLDFAAADAAPDGIEVDQAGNVYVAVKGGIDVYKDDATKIGTIAVPEQPTGMAFGGDDLKTLYITTQGVKIFTTKVNVPGIAQ